MLSAIAASPDDLGREDKLSTAEKRALEPDANLYSVLVTVEHLERAFVNGLVNEKDYEAECQKLIAQFKVIQNARKGQSVQSFILEQHVDCPLAVERLLHSGMVATRMYAAGDAEKESLYVFEASQSFVTLMDALKLNMNAVDEVLPHLKELRTSLAQLQLPELDGIPKIEEWLRNLSQRPAADELAEAEARQFSMDLDTAYSSFHHWLKDKKRE
jgi:ESCRT-I complex subunit VPS28